MISYRILRCSKSRTGQLKLEQKHSHVLALLEPMLTAWPGHATDMTAVYSSSLFILDMRAGFN